MLDEQLSKLLSLGVNIEETLERFVGNEGLYFRCLGKFIDDNNYSLLKEAIGNNDAENAFEAAHALKGVSANLGLSLLYKEVAQITEVFRARSMDYDESNLSKIDEEYKKTIDTLKSLQ
ncbi:MAG: Hpt domain-containing protein [Lachnospiraceae bacterium]|nr:Hpt domain-containing protein [Lachnospiraceae bacterium]